MSLYLRTVRIAVRRVRRLRPLLASAALWCVLLALGGTGALVLGIAILAGAGWACIAFGVLCLAGANVIRVGLSRV